ncbi:MAG: amino acid permease [Phycisphaerales bacterium]|nr:amino acid permease [Phycisphaerales bacterium]
MLVESKRPRNLAWYHSGPLLFGDWGTSRLYVLGLAFYYTGHASPLYLAAMSVLMAAVAWAYTVICRCFPEGGGVYAAARGVSPTLAVIGATLLLCDYIVTASLSAIEAFNYFGVARSWVLPLSLVCLLVLGVINWLGAREAGRFALLIAVAAIVLSAVIALLCVPLLPTGVKTITTGHASISDWLTRWENFMRVILALAGLEAVANMTGLMKQPVARTCRRTIWPVLAEVVILNMVFGIALNALPALQPVDMPHYVEHERLAGLRPENVPPEVREYRDTAMRVLAEHATANATGSPGVAAAAGVAAGIIFGLLLLSAVNTAIMAMVAVQYSMAQDKELPGSLTRLNYPGVPMVPLVLACIAPAVLLVLEADVKSLGELYAIGVVGAIAINLICCAWRKDLPIGPWERRFMWALAAFMSGVFVTICLVKHNATIFAAGMVVSVLLTRFVVKQFAAARAMRPLPEPVTGWLAEIQSAAAEVDPLKPRIMLAARGRNQAEFAVDLAKKRGATLFAIHVRTLRVLDVSPGRAPKLEDDPEGLESLGTMAVLARQARVPFFPIYVCSENIAEEILDYTVTFGCETLIMGKTSRRAFARALEGDVVSQVAALLPEGTNMIVRDGRKTALES